VVNHSKHFLFFLRSISKIILSDTENFQAAVVTVPSTRLKWRSMGDEGKVGI
jgi:hypothetical protein